MFSLSCFPYSQVATTMFDFPILFDVATGEATGQQNMAVADTMMAGCACMRLSPNDALVVSCSTDGSVRVSAPLLSSIKWRNSASVASIHCM